MEEKTPVVKMNKKRILFLNKLLKAMLPVLFCTILVVVFLILTGVIRLESRNNTPIPGDIIFKAD